MLDRFQRREHHRDPALHVGDSGAVQHALLDPARLLERVVCGEHRVHVAREQQLHRGRRADGQMQMAAMLNLYRASGRIDRLDRGGGFEADHSGERGERIGEQVRHSLEPAQIARAAVDRGPGQHLVEHRLGRGALDRLAFAGRQFPHEPAPSRAVGGTPHRYRWSAKSFSRRR